MKMKSKLKIKTGKDNIFAGKKEMKEIETKMINMEEQTRQYIFQLFL